MPGDRFGEDLKAVQEQPTTPPLVEPEYVQSVRYTAPDGEVLTGAFTIRVMSSLADSTAVARVMAIKTGGNPLYCFTPAQQELLHAMALCEVMFGSPEQKRAPKWWFERGYVGLGYDLVVQLAGRQAAHEAAYFLANRGPGGATADGSAVEFLPAGGTADRAIS